MDIDIKKIKEEREFIKALNKERNIISLDNRYNTFGKVNNY